MIKQIESDYGPVAIICPSIGKVCGIARYSSYVANALIASGIQASLLRRSGELLSPESPRYGTVIVQHEYGLFDCLSPLGTGETTSELLSNLDRYQKLHTDARTSIIMHTIVTQDHLFNVLNTQIFSSSIPVFHLNAKGCYELGIPHLEHGVFRYPMPRHDKPVWELGTGEIPPVMGSFGLLSPNKRPNVLIDICARAGANFLGNFATNDKALVNTVVQSAKERGVDAKIYSDFCEEDELIARLQGATFAAVAQEAIPHSATSGSIRFLFNLGVPVLAPYASQFEDCEEAVIFAHPDQMHVVVQSLTTNRDLFREAAERVTRFVERNEMGAVYKRLLKLMHQIPTRELVKYRRRNFREVRDFGFQLTVADFWIRSAENGPNDDEAAERSFVQALKGKVDGAVEELFSHMPLMGPVEWRIVLDRVVSPLLPPADRAALIGMGRFVGVNIRHVQGHLAINASVDPKAQRELVRVLRDAEGRPQLLERREAARLLSGSILHTLRPEIYEKNIDAIADNLVALTARFGDRYGFSNRVRAVASVPVLLALPASQLISYLYRVGRLTAEEIFSLLGTLGLPNDTPADRVEWVRRLEVSYPNRDGIVISPLRPNPRDLRSRSRFFRTELACLTSAEFALVVAGICERNGVGAGEMDRAVRESRRVALLQLGAMTKGLLDIIVIDLNDEAPNLFGQLDAIERAYKTPGAMLQLSQTWRQFDYLNWAEKARHLKWLSDVGPNDLFVTPAQPEAQPAGLIFRMPEELEGQLSPIGQLATDHPARQGFALVFFGPSKPPASMVDSILSASHPTVEASSLGFPVRLEREIWAVPQHDKGASGYRHLAAIEPEYPQVLPDQKWEEAWQVVARRPPGRAVGPDEMRVVSDRIIPAHIAVNTIGIDFVIMHKGREVEYDVFIKDMNAKRWHIIYANEVFLVFARRIYTSEKFSMRFVPKKYRRYLGLMVRLRSALNAGRATTQV